MAEMENPLGELSSSGGQFKKIQDEDLLQRLKPAETDQNKIWQNAADGNWEYPGTEQELTGGAKAIISIIVILVLIGGPLLYMCKKKLPSFMLSQRQNPSPAVQEVQITQIESTLARPTE
ncbi:Oidioi.mRNA.OKI2018_I69.XSR.g15337.t1.cds [Oikopleura dioica]|uniref:Oidioi.mRNA.OKI2018_I69.XSR.g15337.t1.cds n=1 Tax=Oikopleura dioica TaxID=34765 RepID=A0ABN7SHM2_OIKDI|nr:Oidioi.mRNA.OKI2018_I69.XSR.g15337.t1.cds [Oikopleura dioica]